MIIRKAFKFRIKTNPNLEILFAQYAGHCSFVWNKLLRMNLDRWNEGKAIMRYQEVKRVCQT